MAKPAVMPMGSQDTELTRSAIFFRFLRFGLLAWGGPVAQIAMIKRELVDEERWIDPSRFNRLLAVYQVLPGPEAHELCVHFGMMKGRRVGGLLAGLGFMLPGFVLVKDPLVAAIFLGVQIGVIALIVRAVHRISEHALGDQWLLGIAALSALLSFLGISFWVFLPAAGLVYAAIKLHRPWLAAAAVSIGAAMAVLTSSTVGVGHVGAAASAVQAGTVGALPLFLSGLKAGLLTFGGAYTAIPFVRSDAIGQGWLSDGQFLDGLALSGIIPAPLIIFATFVGFLAGGVAGAFAMTAGIFLPAFAFGILFYDQLERVIEDERLHHFLAGVAAGVVGLIAVTAVQMGLGVARSSPSLVAALAIFAVALAVVYLWKSKLATPAVVFGSALAGAVAFALA
jgi:chromate transporter